MREHHYKLTTKWTGNKGTGTSSVSAYQRTHIVVMAHKPELQLTTDNSLYGNPNIHNPEDLLTASLSSCHMMSYLYLCALDGIIVVDYTDEAVGTLLEDPKGGGQFKEVVLNPVVFVKDTNMIQQAIALHKRAHEICFIGNSVNFPVRINPTCLIHV
jgi:organic hydroperoxide reductase OsmC/OhrA